jgi:hypothetical protein
MARLSECPVKEETVMAEMLRWLSILATTMMHCNNLFQKRAENNIHIICLSWLVEALMRLCENSRKIDLGIKKTFQPSLMYCGKTILMYYEAKYKRIAQRFFLLSFFFLNFGCWIFCCWILLFDVGLIRVLE